jgi:hypothetical protein
MVAAVQPFHDAAKCRVDAFDLAAVELAPDPVLQVLQIVACLSHRLLGIVADAVVGGTSLVVRLAGGFELIEVLGIVFCLLLDAFDLALQLVQQTWVTARAPFVISVPAVGAALCIGHLVLLRWLSAWSGAGVTGPLLAKWASEAGPSSGVIADLGHRRPQRSALFSPQPDHRVHDRELKGLAGGAASPLATSSGDPGGVGLSGMVQVEGRNVFCEEAPRGPRASWRFRHQEPHFYQRGSVWKVRDLMREERLPNVSHSCGFISQVWSKWSKSY